MEIKRVAVLGSGIMGHGIAQVSAVAGYAVSLRDVEESLLQKAMANMEKSLNRMVKAGKLSQEEVSAVLGLIIEDTSEIQGRVIARSLLK